MYLSQGSRKRCGWNASSAVAKGYLKISGLKEMPFRPEILRSSFATAYIAFQRRRLRLPCSSAAVQYMTFMYDQCIYPCFVPIVS